MSASDHDRDSGVPLYGRGFEATAGIRQPFTGIGTGTWEAGVYDYKALPFAGASVVEDTVSGSSYSYGSSQLKYSRTNKITDRSLNRRIKEGA